MKKLYSFFHNENVIAALVIAAVFLVTGIIAALAILSE